MSTKRGTETEVQICIFRYKELLTQAGFELIEAENITDWILNPQKRAEKGLKEETDELERLEVGEGCKISRESGFSGQFGESDFSQAVAGETAYK